MNDLTTISFRARILRKQPDLPRYIVIGPDILSGRNADFAAWVRLNGSTPFRRNIRRWAKGSDVFFFNLTAPQCAWAGVDTGEMCDVTLQPLD